MKKIDITEQNKILKGNISHIAKQVKEDTEKNLKSVAKTPEQIEAEILTKEQKEKENKEKGISPELAALMEQNKQIMETLSNIQGEKITKTRAEKIDEILKDSHPDYKKQVLSGFNRMKFENDDDFDSYLNETKTNFESFKQFAKEQGLNTFSPKPEIKKEDKEELNPVFAKAMKAHDEQQKKE